MKIETEFERLCIIFENDDEKRDIMMYLENLSKNEKYYNFGWLDNIEKAQRSGDNKLIITFSTSNDKDRFIDILKNDKKIDGDMFSFEPPMPKELYNDVGQTIVAYFNKNSYPNEKPLFNVKMIRWMPYPDSQEFGVTYSKLFGDAAKVIQEKCHSLGIQLDAQKLYIKIINYHKFLQTIFKDEWIVEDCQRIGKGHPDFKLISKKNKERKVFIEVKKNQDGLRDQQFTWTVENKHEELWFLLLNDKKIKENNKFYDEKDEEGD